MVLGIFQAYVQGQLNHCAGGFKMFSSPGLVLISSLHLLLCTNAQVKRFYWTRFAVSSLIGCGVNRENPSVELEREYVSLCVCARIVLLLSEGLECRGLVGEIGAGFRSAVPGHSLVSPGDGPASLT